MKKILLNSAALAGLVMVSPAAHAQVELELGGWFKGYGAFVDQDEAPDNSATAGVDESAEVNDFDIIRQTELHFGGETSLDNGLTVGFHIETEADGGDSFAVEESYAYFSGGWGRVNFGAEDGAAYLLQVEAPTADNNIDGIRQYVQPVNYAVLTQSGGGSAFNTALLAGGAVALDYDNNTTGYTDKFTYLSPIMNGFQVGLSFTPDSDAYAGTFTGIGTDDVVDTYGRTYEGAIRYEGQFDNVGVIVGAGYAHAELEEEGAAAATAILDPTDDLTEWNVGIDFDIGPFGIGAIYKENDFGEYAVDAGPTTITADEEEVIVVGADYTTGPFKLGISWYNVDNTFGAPDLDTDRYSGGVTYTYGPGMTFRGSIGYVEHDGTGIGGTTSATTTVNDVDATYVTLGTQINF